MSDSVKFLAGTAAVVTFVLGVVALMVWLFTLAAKGSDGPFFIDTAGGVFEQHIQALANEDWEKAHSYLHDNCGLTVAALEDTFDEDDAIDPTEWEGWLIFSAGDDQAFLWFPESNGLQYMTRYDGQWLVNCGAPDG